jgi:protein-S-isoprenylcysteine O-methyltransferase Ste14
MNLSSALIPLESIYSIAPLFWIGGIICLALTRFTYKITPKMGKIYTRLSSILRPFAIMLVIIGWLFLYYPALQRVLIRVGILETLANFNFTDVLCALAAVGFLIFDIWALRVLGARHTLLYRDSEDGIIKEGPYSISRHPQNLAAVGIIFFGNRLIDPSVFQSMEHYHSIDANWALFSVGLILLSIFEEKELAALYGDAYRDYQSRVNRIFPV